MHWRGWEALGPPERVTVIPGNHDIYARIGRDLGTRCWAPYMASDRQGADLLPWSRFSVCAGAGRGGSRRGQLRSTNAAPRWPGDASDAISSLPWTETLAALGAAQLFRVVLIHHPPLPGQASRARGLLDAAALEAALVQPRR